MTVTVFGYLILIINKDFYNFMIEKIYKTLKTVNHICNKDLYVC